MATPKGKAENNRSGKVPGMVLEKCPLSLTFTKRGQILKKGPYSLGSESRTPRLEGDLTGLGIFFKKKPEIEEEN